jgi:hypothetical protein
MTAEYVYRWPDGREEVRHRCPVNSPMDRELKGQLAYLQSVPGGTSCYSRRTVEPAENKQQKDKK